MIETSPTHENSSPEQFEALRADIRKTVDSEARYAPNNQFDAEGRAKAHDVDPERYDICKDRYKQFSTMTRFVSKEDPSEVLIGMNEFRSTGYGTKKEDITQATWLLLPNGDLKIGKMEFDETHNKIYTFNVLSATAADHEEVATYGRELQRMQHEVDALSETEERNNQMKERAATRVVQRGGKFRGILKLLGRQ